jgi:2-polyprenyl-3-methyl-5-hydroxy-6-metoxy-1,4-benzoquinol methylase
MFAINTAEKMIDVATAKIQRTNIKNNHFDVSDVFDARLKAGTFNVIMAYNILCYIKYMSSFYSRVPSLLRPKGNRF